MRVIFSLTFFEKKARGEAVLSLKGYIYDENCEIYDKVSVCHDIVTQQNRRYILNLYIHASLRPTTQPLCKIHPDQVHIFVLRVKEIHACHRIVLCVELKSRILNGKRAIFQINKS